eukprot:COSAG01_NODE_18132_length_1098_cov_10.207207_1_plen_115_part_00
MGKAAGKKLAQKELAQKKRQKAAAARRWKPGEVYPVVFEGPLELENRKHLPPAWSHSVVKHIKILRPPTATSSSHDYNERFVWCGLHCLCRAVPCMTSVPCRAGFRVMKMVSWS